MWNKRKLMLEEAIGLDVCDWIYVPTGAQDQILDWILEDRKQPKGQHADHKLARRKAKEASK